MTLLGNLFHPLTVEEFPGVETTSRLIQLELVSTKVVVILALQSEVKSLILANPKGFHMVKCGDPS